MKTLVRVQVPAYLSFFYCIAMAGGLDISSLSGHYNGKIT